jgi:outer membrane protein OmpA-like peptidoglycan-associated protein
MSRSLLLSLVLLAPLAARAESNRFNLHVSPGFHLSSVALGADVGIGADWQFVKGLGLDVRIGTLLVGTGFGFGPAFNPAVGVRIRLLDDHQGYANQDGGNLAGHLAIAPHLGALIGVPGAGLTIDTEIAYVFSVAKPLQLGPFARPFIGFGTWGVTGGATLGLELTFGLGPELGLDHDGDGVGDESDKCPDTPAGAQVDARGCTIIPRKMVLSGITFRLASAEIDPVSEGPLLSALNALRDNPEATVEISGHTDDLGTPERNQTLSEERARAVAEWLRAHGIDAGRLTTKGYGASKPVVPNTDEASRAKNRRIEFNRTDQP